MDPLLQALQQLQQFLTGTPPVAGPPAPGWATVGTGTPPGAPGSPGGPGTPGVMGSSASWLPLLIQLAQAGGGAYYGMNELQQMQRVYDAQRKAAAIAMDPRMMAKRTAAATLPLNNRLAYIVNAAADQGSASRGMSQAPGAVASARASALAPYAEQNLQLGANLAEFGFPYVSTQTTPDYLHVLDQLNQLGFNSSTYSLPKGTPGTP